MALDANTLRTLEKLIGEECVVCDDYLKILDEEQKCVVKLQSDRVEALSEKRATVAEQLASLRSQRDEHVRKLNNNSKVTLTQLLEQSGTPSEKRRMLPVISKLKQKVILVDQRSKEFNQVVNFSLGLVNGSLSILWSAKQTVTRCYNAFGGMTELFQPVEAREGSLLGKA